MNRSFNNVLDYDKCLSYQEQNHKTCTNLKKCNLTLKWAHLPLYGTVMGTIASSNYPLILEPCWKLYRNNQLLDDPNHNNELLSSRIFFPVTDRRRTDRKWCIVPTVHGHRWAQKAPPPLREGPIKHLETLSILSVSFCMQRDRLCHLYWRGWTLWNDWGGGGGSMIGHIEPKLDEWPQFFFTYLHS